MADRDSEREMRGRLMLVGTTNPSKIAYFSDLLEGFDLRIVAPEALGVTGEPKEAGATPEENARIKAAFYGRYAPYAICADSGLYFDALPLDDPRQPGLHVRMPHGVRLDDEQMIAHYAALSHALGGRALAYYLDGIAVKTPRGIWGFQSTREEALDWSFYLLDEPCEARKPGWPLDSLSVDRNGVSFLNPSRAGEPIARGYLPRLKRFLDEKIGECKRLDR